MNNLCFSESIWNIPTMVLIYNRNLILIILVHSKKPLAKWTNKINETILKQYLLNDFQFIEFLINTPLFESHNNLKSNHTELLSVSILQMRIVSSSKAKRDDINCLRSHSKNIAHLEKKSQFHYFYSICS